MKSKLLSLSIVLVFSSLSFQTRETLSPGTTITVNSTADVVSSSDGFCTLREAVIAANTNTA